MAVKVLGVTGGIGMGKSTCAELLRKAGVPVVDTDDLARDLTAPGGAALKEIAAVFGPGMLDASRALNRRALAEVVFASEVKRRALEDILHPRIRRRWREIIGVWQKEGRHIAAVIIPLLFETGAEKELDAVICVACSERTQRERLALRGWSAAHLASRVAAQLPVAVKMDRANYVLWSEGSIGLLEQQLGKILADIRRANGA